VPAQETPKNRAQRRHPEGNRQVVDRDGPGHSEFAAHGRPAVRATPSLPNQSIRLPGFFLVSEAAREARVSEWTIRREIREGRLQARKIGRLVRILDVHLGNWMRGES
jgi:excisionase family DNA binding protein